MQVYINCLNNFWAKSKIRAGTKFYFEKKLESSFNKAIKSDIADFLSKFCSIELAAELMICQSLKRVQKRFW